MLALAFLSINKNENSSTKQLQYKIENILAIKEDSSTVREGKD
jgi:hypothetical protein